MNTAPDNEFDLEKLFLPAWAQEPSSAKQYAKYEGREERPDRRDDRRGPPPPPLPEIALSLLPDEKGVESLARQIKMTGRAYPLFEIAQMILQKPERHTVVFAVEKNAEGQPIQPLFVCALDETLWLTEEEAVAHVIKKH